MAFSLTSHALLSEKAADLDPVPLAAQTAVAADLLGLAEHEDAIREDADRLAKAHRALVIQVNFQLVHNEDSEAHDEEEMDGLRRRYRDRSVSPRARQLANEVLSDISKLGETFSFEVMRSRR